MSRSRALTLAAALLAPGGPALLAQNRPAPPPVYGATSPAAAMLPMSTASAAARDHATAGQRALDMGHQTEAAAHFREAVAADPSFAFGYLGLANSTTSVADFTRNVRTASRLAPKASRAEQLEIAIAERGLSSDQQGAAALARELVKVAPSNPRAHLALATAQAQLGRESDARQSMERAIAVAPNFTPAYIQLGYSLLLNVPRDPARAEPIIKKAVALEPQESLPYVLLGSWGRATGKLGEARLAYTKAARIDPTNALPLQQRGHVNAFLGDYDAAVADYTAAIRLGRDNQPAQYAVYRALVPVYAGNPRAAITQLEKLVGAIDTMSIPDRDGSRIFALTEEALIATHSGAFAEARSALDRRTALLWKAAADVGTPEFRRTQAADILYYDGLLALHKGDLPAATAKASEAMRQVAANRDPRRDQQAHALLGMVDLAQKNYTNALTHFAQADPNDMYVAYHRALALQGAGRKDEAKRLFREIANYNFSSAGVALVRADAKKRAG